MNTRSTPVKFRNSQGMQLDGRLELPDTPRYFAIMCHCFTCTKNTLTTHRISRGLAQQGIAVLRFDFTGLGKSEGDFADTNFDTMLDDLISAVQFLKQHYQPPKLLMGHSMGGTVALAAAAWVDSCKAVVTIAAPSEPRHVLHHFDTVLDQLEAGRDAQINVAGENYLVKPQFVDNVRAFSMQQHLQGFNKPVMAIRAGHDELVNGRNADEILAMTSAHSASCILDIAQANHLFTDKRDTAEMLEGIMGWLERVLIY